MSSSGADRVARLARRKQVAELTLKGWTQEAIAEKLGVTQSTVSCDLRSLEKEWKKAAVRDVQKAHAVELRKLERLERELWEAWQDSHGRIHGVFATIGQTT